MISRLDRYVFVECLGPVAVGFLVATGLLLIESFFSLAEAMIQRDVPLFAALKLLALNLPHIVVLTIPMALLFGILVAIGRLSTDSELTAMRASGISLLYLFRPILALSVLFALFNTFLMIQVLPWGNRTLQRMTIEEVLKGSQVQAIEARVFNEFIDGRTIYVFNRPPGADRLQGVFIADSLPVGDFNFIVASEGDVRVEQGGRRLVIDLWETLEQNLDLNEPNEAQVTSLEHLVFRLEDERIDFDARSISRVLREMTLGELREVRDDPERNIAARNRAAVEIHKKFSIPVVCVVFGLLALPLGFNRHSGNRSSAFVQALSVIVVYYVLQSVGEETAAKGFFRPWQAMWLPNLLFLVAGAFLLARKNHDKSLLLSRVDRWIRAHSWRRLLPVPPQLRLRRRQRRAVGSSGALAGRSLQVQPRFVLRVPRFSISFPGRLDRYVLKIFFQTLLIVTGICIGLFMVVDVAGLVEHILANDISLSVLGEYYFYYSLQIFYTVSPIAVLLTTLISFGLLARSNEITAVKAAGVSLYRMAIPALVAGFLATAATAALDLTVLPAVNAREGELRAAIKGKALAEGRRKVTRQWYYSATPDGGSVIYNYRYQVPDAAEPRLQAFQAFRFDEGYHLSGHFYAREIRRIDGEWYMGYGWARRFENNEVTDYTVNTRQRRIDLLEAADFFSAEIKNSLEMNYWELRDYIDTLESSGQQVPHLELQLWNKVAMPVVSFVMVLVALPFSFRLGRQGTLYGVGIAVILGMALFGVLAFFTTLGETATIPPILAAWSPNVLFGLLSMYLFLGVRS